MRKCVLIVLCLFLQMHRTAVGEGLQFTMIDVGMAECMIVICGSETIRTENGAVYSGEMITGSLIKTEYRSP